MFTSSISYFNGMLYDTTKGTRGSKGANLIYRDELSKKISPKKIERGGNCLARKEKDERKNSEKRGWGLLEFKDVAHELVQLPVNRVSVVSSNGGYGGVLHSIPEEKQLEL
ncbi:hypothetical protein DKX38_004661 [Salix brachista]|uniref:DUF7890 domain-containing protein n=1 Tax=Salix brachista TaxID=2182728 RepID=A0A5N5NCA3_9ROSI|nr:hypothetical protein DKX38_004661 [Salix brachista]